MSELAVAITVLHALLVAFSTVTNTGEEMLCIFPSKEPYLIETFIPTGTAAVLTLLTC